MIHAWDDPIKETGHIQILRGNLAPDGCVAKITGKEGLTFSGTAIAFDSEEAMLAALERGEIRKGHVIVIRYEGPRGGPGMREMLTPTSAIVGMGLAKDTALITDGRFSGGSAGFIIGHVTPEAQDGGPIALVRDGDRITIDAKKRVIELEVSAAELEKRRAAWSRAAAARAARRAREVHPERAHGLRGLRDGRVSGCWRSLRGASGSRGNVSKLVIPGGTWWNACFSIV